MTYLFRILAGTAVICMMWIADEAMMRRARRNRIPFRRQLPGHLAVTFIAASLASYVVVRSPLMSLFVAAAVTLIQGLRWGIILDLHKARWGQDPED